MYQILYPSATAVRVSFPCELDLKLSYASKIEDTILTFLSTLYLLGDVGFTTVQAFLHLYIICQHVFTHILSPGESGNGSSLASCVVRGVAAVDGEKGGGRRGDSKRACPRPESSESVLTSTI